MLETAPVQEGNSEEGDELHDLSSIVDDVLRSVESQLSQVQKKNGKFYTDAARQIEEYTDSRKLLSLVLERKDFPMASIGLGNIEDKIMCSLKSLKEIGDSTEVMHQQHSINDLSKSVLTQMQRYIGTPIRDMDYEEVMEASVRMSDCSEKLRMASAHVFEHLTSSLGRISEIPKDAPQAFIWMEFKECLVEATDTYAFPLAKVPVDERKCCYCQDQQQEQLIECKMAAPASGSSWYCPNYFHATCRANIFKCDKTKESKRIKVPKVPAKIRDDKQNDACCFECLLNISRKELKRFRGAKFIQAAHVGFPHGLNFCEIHSHIADKQSEPTVHSVKPGLFPFLSFGCHHAETGKHCSPRRLQFWIEPAKKTDLGCKIVEEEKDIGYLHKFSGEIQTQVQRCTRLGVLTAASLRQCGLDSKTSEAATPLLMQKMRESEMTRDSETENEKLKLTCAKKVECWTFALARNNGDVVITTATAPLSGAQPFSLRTVPSRTLTVNKNDTQRCGAERVAWNCDGSVLAASCEDRRVVFWERRDIVIDEKNLETHDNLKETKPVRKTSSCELQFEHPIVSLTWSPVRHCVLLVATVGSCFVLNFKPSIAGSPAEISIQSSHAGSSGITCATFGSNGNYIAVGTQASGWFDIHIDSSNPQQSSHYNLSHGSACTVTSICALPITTADAMMDGRDFAVASVVASGSLVHIWKFSDFMSEYQVVKDFRLPSSLDSRLPVTSLLCSRDNERDADSFKILAVNGSSTGYIINYLGGNCYVPEMEPVLFRCPQQGKEVNVSRAAWGKMAHTIAFCDFSYTKSREEGGVWWGLPNLYELWRLPMIPDIVQRPKNFPVSNHWQTNRRDKFGAAETCDLSAHTVVQECKAGQEKEGGIVESVWNRDVLLHQQVVTDVANCWKEFAKQHVISSGTVEKVVQLIAVIVPAIVHTSSLVFLLV